MKPELPALENVPHESMLTYAVLCGQQARKNDPLALGALITDMAVRGYLCIGESAPNGLGLVLPETPDSDLFEEEAVFMAALQKDCTISDTGYIALDTITKNKAFITDMRVLWRRVVMMHHTNYNQDRPLYNVDPTGLTKWQRFRRTWGWILAVGSVYAEPGWQGHVAGLSEVQKGYEAPELLGYTKEGHRLRHHIVAIRRQMLQLTKTGASDISAIAAYEKALPFAFLFDDTLSKDWPIFLSQAYTEYPAWLQTGQPAKDIPTRQSHIAALISKVGTLCFPANKRRARLE